MNERTMVEADQGVAVQLYPWVVILGGVSGSGKTTVGKKLARAIDADFLEGDDFHAATSIARMRANIPLRDEDRWPWLDRIAEALAVHARHGRNVVVACSALKHAYRRRLEKKAGVPLIFTTLSLPRAVLEARLAARQGHFMPAALLESQLATLQPLALDEHGRTIDANGSPDDTVAAIRIYLDREAANA